MIQFVDLKAQYRSIKNEIDQAIQSVVDDCAFVQGPHCERFDANFAKACGKEFSIGCANGTVALEVVFEAYGLSEGDEVIVPSHTFIATAEALTNLGVKVVFAEIDERTYTIDPKDIEKRITSKTKAIVPVHVYGQAADMDPILEIAKKHNLIVIEDCAQAHLAKYKGKTVPYGETGCFSFFPGKNLGAYGDAGGIVTSNAQLAKKIKQRLNHGREEGEKYKHASIGTNYRMDGIQGAILDVKLKYLPQWTESRRKVAAKYNEALKNKEGIITPHEPEDRYHVYHLYVIRSTKRDELMAKFKANDVACGIHYPIPLHLQPAYANLGYKEGDFPITEKVAKEILSLPMYAEISDEDIERVISLL